MSAPMKPITIRGILYPSYRDAAVALGVTSSAISQAVSRGKADLIGMPESFTGRIKPGEQRAAKAIRIQGVTYPSQALAAEVLGVTQGAISTAKRRGALASLGIRRRA